VRIGWTAGGVESTQVVTLAEAEARVSFHVDRPPDWIAVDPEFDVLRRIHTAEIPPALSRVLGADSAVAIIAAGLDPALEEAYRAVALEWQKGNRLGIVQESDLPQGGAAPEVPAWYLGAGPRALAQVGALPRTARREGAWMVAGTDVPVGHGVVLAGTAPEHPERAWGMVEGSSPRQIAALGRKVPHYGKYGYLVFEEDRNVAKGSWEITASPLRATL
jgi:hypothetical protein